MFALSPCTNSHHRLPPFEIVPRVGTTSFTKTLKEMAENETADIFPERFVMSPSRYRVAY